jgi:predicted outer membrane repeat protein
MEWNDRVTRLLTTVSAVALATALLVVGSTSPAAAQTPVGTEAELRTAFSDSDETSILLTADIAIEQCAFGLLRNSATAVVVDGGGHSLTQTCPNRRVFLSQGTGTLTIRNLTVSGGRSPTDTDGGALNAAGDVVVENATFTDNQAVGVGSSGGAIYAAGDVTVVDSTFTHNTAGSNGGAIVLTGAVTVAGSTFTDNTATRGGALYVTGTAAITSSTFTRNRTSMTPFSGGGAIMAAGQIFVVDSTFTENESAPGGAIYASGPLTVTNSTVTGNVAQAGGGLRGSDDVTLVHATVVGNTGGNIQVANDGRLRPFGSVVASPNTGDNCMLTGNAVVMSDGFNFADDASCDLGAASDVEDGGDPELGALAANGGPTHTMLPEPGSPLVDAIPAASCDPAVSTDQRGVTRPQGEGCDIGAVEAAGVPEDDPDDPDPEESGSGGVHRLAGPSRFATAVEISRNAFADGGAGAVVLARGDVFADGLAGTPLAVDRDAPILLSPTSNLPAEVRAELERVLPPGGTVYLLGGSAALSNAVEQTVLGLGYQAVRLAGANRLETAVAIARELGDPATLLVTTGFDFPDALAAAATGAHVGAAVLLTTADAPHPTVDTYLAERPGAAVYAVGGPAARAYPAATPVFGPGREETAVQVAETFFTDPAVVGLARRDDFPDALSGGAHIGRLGGPLLLTPSATLHPVAASYVCSNASGLTTGYVYGGTGAVSATAAGTLGLRLQGIGCG